jgi:hypothetical protein
MIACTIQWFNPLVWVLSELARRDAELAADDLVVSAGVRPSSYAATLLSFAESLLPFTAAEPAMPLIKRKLLAYRVDSILRESKPRLEVAGTTRFAVLGASCGLAMLAACVQLVPRSSYNPTLTVQAPEIAASAAADAPAAQSASVRPDSGWVADATVGLIVALSDPSPQVRGEAAHALGNLRASAAREPLTRLLDDADKFVQYETRQALSRLAPSR